MASDRQQRYYDRQQYHEGDQVVSDTTYNLIIGGLLLYGFIINAIMVTFFYDSIESFVISSGWVFFLVYFGLCIAGSLLVHGSKNPVVSFIGYNLIVVPLGLVLSIIVNAYLSFGYESTVTYAFIITGIVTLAMMFISSLFPQFFLSIGKTLFLSLLLTIVVELVMMLVGAPLEIIDYIVVVIFCGYIGYDWARANACVKTVDNAVDSAAELYVDIINLFIRILSILGNKRN